MGGKVIKLGGLVLVCISLIRCQQYNSLNGDVNKESAAIINFIFSTRGVYLLNGFIENKCESAVKCRESTLALHQSDSILFGPNIRIITLQELQKNHKLGDSLSKIFKNNKKKYKDIEQEVNDLYYFYALNGYRKIFAYRISKPCFNSNLSEAIVYVEDGMQGPLSGSTYQLHLKKINGYWIYNRTSCFIIS